MDKIFRAFGKGGGVESPSVKEGIPLGLATIGQRRSA